MIATKSYSPSDSRKRIYKDIKWYCIQTQYVPNLRSLVRQQAPDLFAVHFSGLIATVEEKGCAAEREAFNARALDQDWTGEKEPNAIQSEWSLFSLVFWSCRGILCRKCRCAFSKDKCRTLATAIQTKVPETRSKGKGDSLSARTIRYIM